MPPSPSLTTILVVRDGVKTEHEVGSLVDKDLIISFRVPVGMQRRLVDALGGELEYASVSFGLCYQGIEHPRCRVDAWYRNGMVVIHSLPPPATA